MQLLSIIALLAHCPGLSLSTALPASLPLLPPRAQYCANAPSTIAGTLLPRHLSLLPPPTPPSSALPPRDPRTIVWCSPHSRIYITITALTTLPAPTPSTISTLLTSAAAYVATHIHELGDSVMARGQFRIDGGGGLALRTWNANNHQQTWGTLWAAVDALRDYMRANGYAGVEFGVFDGSNMVAEGVLGRV